MIYRLFRVQHYIDNKRAYMTSDTISDLETKANDSMQRLQKAYEMYLSTRHSAEKEEVVHKKKNKSIVLLDDALNKEVLYSR